MNAPSISPSGHPFVQQSSDQRTVPSCRSSRMQRSPLAVRPPTFRPAHHVCSSPVPAFINPTQPGKVAQCCLVLPSSLVLYRRRSLWEAFVQCNRNISPLIILGSSCGAGLKAKGPRRWMRLRMICAWPTHSLRVVCASTAHRLRIVCEQSGNSAFGAMPGMSSLLVPGVRPSACENAASSTVACD